MPDQKSTTTKALLNLKEIQDKVSALGKEYGADRIFLFGSYAKGTAKSDSDVDLRIDRGEIKGWALGGLLIDLEQSLGKKVDLLTTGSLDQAFLNAIKDEEVLLYISSPNRRIDKCFHK